MGDKRRKKQRKYVEIVETFDRLADKYGFPQGMEEVNRRKLAPLVRDMSGPVLDVGCGTGTFIEKYLDPARHTVVSADFSANMLGHTRRLLKGQFNKCLFLTQALAQELPFRDGLFQGCVCVNTLHNMPGWEDVERAVSEMARVLRPGGRLLIEFRNRLNPTRRRISALYDYDHLPQKAFATEDVLQLLHNTGLTLEQKLPLFGDNPDKPSVADAAMAGLIGARAPRIAMLAVKSHSFDSMLKNAGGK